MPTARKTVNPIFFLRLVISCWCFHAPLTTASQPRNIVGHQHAPQAARARCFPFPDQRRHASFDPLNTDPQGASGNTTRCF